jgi:ABC-2 type transport system ATP-binding protein
MIEVEHLSKIYGSTTAIQDVTFRAEPGEILGLLGPNGAGKTTTMRILSGYLPATRGAARIAGYEVHENPMAVRQRIGYLPETPPLYPDMTVEQYLHFVARIKGVAAGDRTAKIQSALQRCTLQDKARVHIRKLSKGYRQRVGIAQAIVHDPPAIILDEPTVGLDPRQIIEVRQVSMTCDRVAIISRGHVVAEGSPESLTDKLTGGSAYELELEGDRTVIAERLNAALALKTLDWLNREGLATGHLRLRVSAEANPDFGKQLAMNLVAANIGIHEMRRTNSLEDVFLQLTTEEKTIDAAETSGTASKDASPTSEEDGEVF